MSNGRLLSQVNDPKSCDFAYAQRESYGKSYYKKKSSNDLDDDFYHGFVRAKHSDDPTFGQWIMFESKMGPGYLIEHKHDAFDNGAYGMNRVYLEK